MSTLTAPTDLRVVNRKLASIAPQQLPHALPSLVEHVLRCKTALAAPQDPKAKGDKSETAMLVHKLKASITTHLTSRTKQARFAAVALVKAAVDVGGWEVLRGCLPWVQGLLSIVQKGDPAASKELAIVTLTKIYMLLHPYQTLVREIATPTIPAFAAACVQILKSSASEQDAASLGLRETTCDSLSALVPLYPATLRPSSTQIHHALRPLMAPTVTDEILVPDTLQEAARRLVVLQHYVAVKSGGSDEWNKHIDSLLEEIHRVADQVLRAVDEAEGRSRTEVALEAAPSTGPPESQYPFWVGIAAGGQRLTGLLRYLSACLLYSTKGAVAIPLGMINGVISRLCLVARQSPKSQTWEQALQTKASIGREEKEELWSVLPDIHIAALQVAQTAFERLGEDMVPLALESLDHTVRVFNSGISLPPVRSATYEAAQAILSVAGPTLSKPYVDMLGTIIGACCRDLQEDAGHLAPPARTASTANGKKSTAAAAAASNADLFLKKPDASSLEAPVANKLEPTHRRSASAFLAVTFSHLPQVHLKPSLRGLLDQTAILTRDRDAMVASILNPFTDPRGRRYASILPHLTQLHPRDPTLEVLRSNLRTDGAATVHDGEVSDDDGDEAEEGDQDVDMGEAAAEGDDDAAAAEGEVANPISSRATQPSKPDLPAQRNPFESTPVVEAGTTKNGFGDIHHRAQSPPKRKHESEGDSASAPPKRHEVSVAAGSASAATLDKQGQGKGGDESDSDESVHLNMVLEDDEDDDDDEL